MSLNNGDDGLQASNDSFWEVGKFMRTVKRIDNGYSLCSTLKQLINSRAEIERNYAKQLNQWSKKWNDFLEKGPEYGTTQGAWRGVLAEADKVADLHIEVGDKLVNEVTTSIKLWQKENYHKSMMHFKETKEMEDQFRKVQKPWEKKLNKVLAAKKDYHTACKNEKSTANQENNARSDTTMSTDQLKKLQEKLKKFQQDVEVTQDKYNACLTDLNGSNSKYIEEMTEVFTKCQTFEERRIDFFKKIMFDIHSCLDLSVDSRFSQVYTDLHGTICNTAADKDLQWWSNCYGADMPMAWPVFEEYSPDLKPIHGKEGKKSQVSTGEGGITITSIKQNQDNFVASPSTNNRSNRDSQASQKSQNNYGYSTQTSDPASDPAPPVASHSSNPARYSTKSFGGKSSNPFDADTTRDATIRAQINSANRAQMISENRAQMDAANREQPNYANRYQMNATIRNQRNAAIRAQRNSANRARKNTNTEPSNTGGSSLNPFPDDSDTEEQASQDSAGMADVGGSVSIPIRVVYTYKAEEEDEISADQGEVLTRLSEQDDMGWVKAKSKDGREGLIPYGYVEDI